MRDWVGLDRLRTEYGMDTPQLVKFMSNSVAAEMDSPDFWGLGPPAGRIYHGLSLACPMGAQQGGRSGAAAEVEHGCLRQMTMTSFEDSTAYP